MLAAQDKQPFVCVSWVLGRCCVGNSHGKSPWHGASQRKKKKKKRKAPGWATHPCWKWTEQGRSSSWSQTHLIRPTTLRSRRGPRRLPGSGKIHTKWHSNATLQPPLISLFPSGFVLPLRRLSTSFKLFSSGSFHPSSLPSFPPPLFFSCLSVPQRLPCMDTSAAFKDHRK